MDPLSQAAIGAAASQSGSSGAAIRHALWIGALAGMAPDLDVFIRSARDPLLFLEYHRQFTHSLFFIPIGALICAVFFYPLAKNALSFRAVWWLAMLGYGTHGLLDACTTYGTQLLWPLTDARFAWHNVSVIDPLFTLPLAGLVIAGAIRRHTHLALGGLCWAILYLSFGVVQNHRALDAAEKLVISRGHDPIRLEVKPGFANLLLWKVSYEYDERYYVDAIRAGITSTYFPGESTSKLDVPRDFPWLDPDSQQAGDIARFRWFSDNWLAVDGRDPSLIVDMRYSQLPNAIKGLWGIRLREGAQGHVQWINQRTTGSEEFRLFTAQLSGDGGRPLLEHQMEPHRASDGAPNAK